MLRSLNKEALYYITKITREIKNSKYDSQHITENNAKNFNDLLKKHVLENLRYKHFRCEFCLK